MSQLLVSTNQLAYYQPRLKHAKNQPNDNFPKCPCSKEAPVPSQPSLTTLPLNSSLNVGTVHENSYHSHSMMTSQVCLKNE